MTLFRPPSPPPQQKPTAAQPIRPTRQAGDRSLVYRDRQADVPSHRRESIGPTQNKEGCVGLRGDVVLDRPPRGCLFRVKGSTAFFDLDGYYCLKKADGEVEVRRGAPKKLMRRLTEDQKRMLGVARNRARRHGLR